MQAAITLRQRGHKVILAETEDRLGGTLNFTDIDVDKEDLRNVKNVIVREVMESGTRILLKSRVDAALIKEIQPDCIVAAIGAHPVVPPIPGIESAHHAFDVYTGFLPGKNILMIGGGLVGCETALHLQKTGHNVLVVEMLDRIAKDSYGMYREALLLEMEKCGVIEGYTVILGSNGVERSRSVLFDIQVSPACFNQVADALAAQEAVADLYLLSGECRLLARFVMEFSYDLDRFAQEMIYSLPGIEHVRSAFIISQLKSGGACKSRP